MTTQNDAIIHACRVQAESCQYTSTSLYRWLDDAKWHNRAWNALPIVFGSIASVALFQESFPYFASFFALTAGLLPAVYEKLELKAHTDEILSQAGQYKNLENRFTHAADIVALDSNPDALKAEFDSLMRQMEDLRARPIVIPEKYFLKGRAKIMAGHLKTDVSA